MFDDADYSRAVFVTDLALAAIFTSVFLTAVGLLMLGF